MGGQSVHELDAVAEASRSNDLAFDIVVTTEDIEPYKEGWRTKGPYKNWWSGKLPSEVQPCGSTSRGKVSPAKGRYEALVAQLPYGRASEGLTALGGRNSPHGDHTQPYECPACRNRGCLIWNVELAVEHDGPGERLSGFPRFRLLVLLPSVEGR